MIQYGDLNRNVDTNDILLLLAKCYTEDCMDTPSTFHTRNYYVLKSQIRNPETPTYMEDLSGEKLEEYFKEMDDETHSIMRRETQEIVSRKSVDDNNVLPGTWSFKCKRKPDWTIRKFKE